MAIIISKTSKWSAWNLSNSLLCMFLGCIHTAIKFTVCSAIFFIHVLLALFWNIHYSEWNNTQLFRVIAMYLFLSLSLYLSNLNVIYLLFLLISCHYRHITLYWGGEGRTRNSHFKWWQSRTYIPAFVASS